MSNEEGRTECNSDSDVEWDDVYLPGSCVGEEAPVLCDESNAFMSGRMSPASLLEQTEHESPGCTWLTEYDPKKSSIIVAAKCVQRVSRCAAGAGTPSATAIDEAIAIRQSREQAAINSGRQIRRIQPTSKSTDGLVGFGGKSKSICSYLRKEDEAAINRILPLKRRLEPKFMGEEEDVVWQYKHATHISAVGNAIVSVWSTRSAALQTTRLSSEYLGRSIASGVTECELVRALVANRMRGLSNGNEWYFGNPVSWNAFDTAALLVGNSTQGKIIGAVTPTTRVFSAMPWRLGSSGITVLAGRLARMEASNATLSNEFGNNRTNHILLKLVKSVLKEQDAPYDYVWACILLLTYTISNPRGRQLLPQDVFTDFDISMAVALARYAQALMTKNINYFKGKRRRSTSTKRPPPLTEDDACKEMASTDDLLRGATEGFDPESHLRYWDSVLESRAVCGIYSLVCEDLDCSTMASLEVLMMQSSQTKSDIGKYSILQEPSREHANSTWQVVMPLVDTASGVNFQSVVTANVNLSSEQGLALGGATHDAPIKYVGMKHAVESEHVKHFAAFYVTGPGEYAPLNYRSLSIAWSIVSQPGRDLVGICGACPGLTETLGLAREHKMKRAKTNNGCNGKARAFSNPTDTRKEELFKRQLGKGYNPLPTFLQDFPAAIIVTERVMQVWPSDLRAADEVHDVLVKSIEETDTEPSSSGSVESVHVMRHEAIPEVFEPPIEPSSAIAVGVLTSQLLGTVLEDRTRKDRPCLWKPGVDESTHATHAYIADTSPIPIMPLTQVEMQFIDDKPYDATGMRRVAISHHVRAKEPMRLVDVVAKISIDPIMGRARWFHCRNLLLGAAIQASDVSDFAHHLLPGTALNSIACAHKTTNPDISSLPAHLLTDVYLTEYTNLEPLCVNTRYHATYGPGYHHGLQSCGFGNCIQRLGGERCFAKTAFAQQLIDDLTTRISQECMQHCEHFDAEEEWQGRPPEAAGIPYSLHVGLHAALDPLKDALDAVVSRARGKGAYPGLSAAVSEAAQRECSADDICSTARPGFMVFPYAQFTQNLAPNAVQGLHDTGARTHTKPSRSGVDVPGRVKLLDATPEEEAILCEPLFRRPTKEVPSDNPINTVHEEMGTVLLALSSLSEIAKLVYSHERDALGKGRCEDPSACAAEVVAALHRLLCAEHRGDSSDAPHVLAADAMRDLNTIYPTQWEVNTNLLLDVYAGWQRECSATAYVQFKHGEEPIGLSLRQYLQQQKVVDPSNTKDIDSNKYWASFSMTNKTDCVWENAIQPFLEMLVRWNGYHLSSLEQFQEAKQNLDNVVRFAYNVHATKTLQDGSFTRSLGVPPSHCPCKGAGSPTGVTRHHVDAVFIGFDGGLPRGPLCGVKPFQYRQLLTLSIGATYAETVNVRRVIGHMEKALTKAADVRANDGKKKTFKQTHCLQVDRDTEAFGTMEDRERASIATRPGMIHNCRLLYPLFIPLSKPPARNTNELAGSKTEKKSLRKQMHEYNKHNNNCTELFEQNLAKAIMIEAFGSPANTESHAKLVQLGQR